MVQRAVKKKMMKTDLGPVILFYCLRIISVVPLCGSEFSLDEHIRGLCGTKKTRKSVLDQLNLETGQVLKLSKHGTELNGLQVLIIILTLPNVMFAIMG